MAKQRTTRNTRPTAPTPAREAGAGPRTPAPGAPLRIRKYANRRLYDQTTSRHLTGDELHALVVAGHDVVITDATTEDDITNIVLAQLLIERDPLKLAAIPSPVLHAMIRTNARMLQSTIAHHLAAMLQSFSTLQRSAGMGWAPPSGGAAAPTEWFQRAVGWPSGWPLTPPRVAAERSATDADPTGDAATAALRREVDALRRELEEMRAAPRAARTARSGKRSR